MLRNDAIDPRAFAAGVRELLVADPRRYRMFGDTWFFVKALLRRFYDKHNLYFLAGSYEDPTVVERVPAGLDAYAMMARASAEYESNARLGRRDGECVDDEGQFFTLLDPDVEG